MKKPRVEMTILKELTGYSAFANIANNSVFTQGENFEELKHNIADAVNLAFEDKGYIYTPEEIYLSYDLPSFFDFYKVLNVSALAKRLNMSQSLLAQYICGKKKPSGAQKERILKEIQQVGRELSGIRFVG
jgi:hypothetical protein